MTEEETAAKKYFDETRTKMMKYLISKKKPGAKISNSESSKIAQSAEKMTKMKYPNVSSVQTIGITPWQK